VGTKGAVQVHPWEGGWDTGVGRTRSTKPNSRILIENPWPALPNRKSMMYDLAIFSSAI